MAAVLLACTSAVLFGAMTVALRYALRRNPDPELGAMITTASGFLACGLIAAADAGGTLAATKLAPFALAGLMSPGLAQLLFTRAVREAGPSRTSVTVGTAPLVSVVIAVIFLGEPVRPALIGGAVLIVLGGTLLIGERIRPDRFRRIGLAFAFGATVLFSTRDNIVRWLSGDTPISPLTAGATTLLAGTCLLVVYVLAGRGPRAFAGIDRGTLTGYGLAGVLFGLSYAALFEAYYRGRVTVVSPLVSAESLWGVLFSALIIGRSELIGKRLVFGAVLIVAGGVLIGAFRS